MPVCLTRYRDKEKAQDYRKRHRKKNYAKSRENAFASGKKWTDEEVVLVMSHSISDSVLSKQIGRSVEAIQQKRNKENKKAT